MNTYTLTIDDTERLVHGEATAVMLVNAATARGRTASYELAQAQPYEAPRIELVNLDDAPPEIAAKVAEWVAVEREPQPDLAEQFAVTDNIVDSADPIREQIDEEREHGFASMTAKELRPLASAAGMKGARVARKDALVAFLVGQR